MRVTIDLPDEILRLAKLAAEKRSLTLSEIVAQCIASELALRVPSSENQKMIEFPLKRSKSPRSLNLTNSDIQWIEDEDEEKRHGFRN